MPFVCIQYKLITRDGLPKPFDQSVLSLLGVVALSGVVVNDSLLLVVFVNRAKEKGDSTLKAVTDAVRSRFRPVILTSLTTFLKR